MKTKKIYILLSDTGTLFTKTIKAYTKKPFNHASISLDSNLENVYSFGRKMPRNPFIGGFVKENIQEGLFQQARCAIYACTVTIEQYEKIKDYIQQMEEEKSNYRYNLIGLLGFLINKPIKRKNAFFCSQFVATVLQNSGVVTFNKPLSLITPHDIQLEGKLELIYQGNITNYNDPKESLFFHHI